MLKNPVFLCRVKIPYQQFLTFLSFMSSFKSSRSQMFFDTPSVDFYTARIQGINTYAENCNFPILLNVGEYCFL